MAVPCYVPPLTLSGTAGRASTTIRGFGFSRFSIIRCLATTELEGRRQVTLILYRQLKRAVGARHDGRSGSIL